MESLFPSCKITWCNQIISKKNPPKKKRFKFQITRLNPLNKEKEQKFSNSFVQVLLLLTLHHKPVLVWIVAPVTSSTSSADPLNSTSNFFNTIANTTVDSNNANWSPTHFRGPPPNGRKAKSAITWYIAMQIM